MLYFLDLGGDVKRIDTDKIYQGANDGAQIQLITPITPTNSSIEVAFQYPNGLVTTYYPMAIVGRYSLQDLDTTDLDNYGNIQVYMWQISLLPNVTKNAGTVVVTFKVTKPANVESYASVELFPETGESGVYYVCDGTYYEWENGQYVETTDTIAIINNAYKQIATSGCPFTVQYAALPAPPEEVTTNEMEQILTLANLYYNELSARVEEIERTRYIGTIAAADWEQVGNRYFYTLPASAHGYTHPIVTETLVEDEEADGYTSAFFSFTILANNNISFVSDRAVNATFAIIG